MLEVFQIGKGKHAVSFARATSVPGEWFLRPCPVHELVAVCDGVRTMKHPDYNTLFYSITDIKQKCSDALAPKVCDAIDGVIARLEKKHGVEIDPNKPECDGVPGKF